MFMIACIADKSNHYRIFAFVTGFFRQLRTLKIFRLVRKQPKMGLLMLWMAIVPLSSSLIVSLILIAAEDQLLVWGQLEWVLFYALSVLTMAMAVTPTTYIAIVSGYFLGWEGLVYVVVAYQLASLLGYSVAKGLSENFISNLIKYYPKSSVYFDNISRKQFSTTFLSRISPALPFALMNVMLSAAKIRLAPFFGAGFLGMLPRTLFFVWAGSQAQIFSEALQSKQGIVWSILLSILGVYLLFKLIKGRD